MIITYFCFNIKSTFCYVLFVFRVQKMGIEEDIWILREKIERMDIFKESQS